MSVWQNKLNTSKCWSVERTFLKWITCSYALWWTHWWLNKSRGHHMDYSKYRSKSSVLCTDTVQHGLKTGKDWQPKVEVWTANWRKPQVFWSKPNKGHGHTHKFVLPSGVINHSLFLSLSWRAPKSPKIWSLLFVCLQKYVTQCCDVEKFNCTHCPSRQWESRLVWKEQALRQVLAAHEDG